MDHFSCQFWANYIPMSPFGTNFIQIYTKTIYWDTKSIIGEQSQKLLIMHSNIKFIFWMMQSVIMQLHILLWKGHWLKDCKKILDKYKIIAFKCWQADSHIEWSCDRRSCYECCKCYECSICLTYATYWIYSTYLIYLIYNTY